MKKLLLSAYSLDIGGIETALVTLLNYLVEKEYNITLILEKKQGIFINNIDKRIKIIEYTPDNSKNKMISKIKNFINRIKFILKYKNQYDCAISFATYSLPSSFVARNASKNNVLWVHNNYLNFYDNDENKYLYFFNKIKVNKFKKIVFVSEESKNDFEKRYIKLKKKLIVCNNLIDYKNIKEKSKEIINDCKHDELIFLNIGRHDEKQKKLSRLIEAAKLLQDNNYKFKIILIGDGENTEEYKKAVKTNDLEDKVIFLGSKKNPYPYYKIADCVILTSEYEGFPVVYIESLIFNKPIITTKVSDSQNEIAGKYGLVCERNVNDIFENMRYFIENGYKIKKPFNVEEYNKLIIEKIENIICEEK